MFAMKTKFIFMDAIKVECRILPDNKAQLVIGLANNISEDTLPPDVQAAAKRLVNLVSRLDKEIPIISG